MSSKQRKRFKTGPQLAAAPGTNLIEVHRTGDQVQRIEFNFDLILQQYGAQLFGVDFAPDRVILHCTPGSQEAFVLENAKVIENLVDNGLVPRQESTSPETPSPTDKCRTESFETGQPEGSGF